jgi:gentisate 1,2-dioxygenase
MLEAGFFEEYHQERQGSGAADNASQWHYPMSEMRAALLRLAANTASADGIILEYINRGTGGPVMPTIDCHMQLLRPGEKTQVRRSVCCKNYHVIEGAGFSIVGDQRFAWEDKDVFTVPTWTFCEHVNNSDRPAFLFSFSDAPVMKALSLYRDEQDRSCALSRRLSGNANPIALSTAAKKLAPSCRPPYSPKRCSM